MKNQCLHREIWLLTKGQLALTGQKSARMSLQIMDAEWQEMKNSRDDKKYDIVGIASNDKQKSVTTKS